MLGYTNIPALLCEYALINRKVNQLKLFIYLKINCSGEIEYNESSYSTWAKEICVNSKTVKTSLKWLIKNKWVTVNSKKKTLRIISYKNLSKKLNIDFNTGYLFEPESYKYFKAMCCGIVITFYLNRKRYFNRRSGNIKGFAMSKNRKKNNKFYPMPNGYLAECLGLSIATAYRYKDEAEKQGFIKTKSNLSFIENNIGERITADNYFALILENQKNSSGKIRKGVKYLKEVEPDLIHSNITLKKKSIIF